VLSAVVVFVTATLPGTPFYSHDGAGSLAGAIFWSALLVVGIAARWRPVWYLGVFVNLVGVIIGGITAFWDESLTFHPKALLVALSSAALVRILLSEEIDDRMWHRPSVQA
jgi:hypothetical protein